MLETLEQVKTAEPVPPSRLVPGLPRDVETIALKCLQKDPAKRYESAAALAEDLRRFQAGEPIVARPVGPVERAWRWCRRNPVVAGSLGATAAALVAVAVLATVFAVKQAEARNESNRRLQESRLRVAALDYERGQDACEKGEIGLGLLRLVESWRSAVAAGDPGPTGSAPPGPAFPPGSATTPSSRRSSPMRARVLSVAFSPDGKTVITGSDDKYGAALGRGDGPAPRPTPDASRRGQGGGVQPRRQDRAHRERRTRRRGSGTRRRAGPSANP